MIKETYFAIANKLPKDVHKEYVMRGRFNSVLSPSWNLVDDYKKGIMTWGEYEKRFRNEILNNPLAIKRLIELIEMSETKDVYLICYEKLPKPCHRFILIEIMKELKKREKGEIESYRAFIGSLETSPIGDLETSFDSFSTIDITHFSRNVSVVIPRRLV